MSCMCCHRFFQLTIIIFYLTLQNYNHLVQVPGIVPVPCAVLIPGTSSVHLFLHLDVILQSIFNHAARYTIQQSPIVPSTRCRILPTKISSLHLFTSTRIIITVTINVVCFHFYDCCIYDHL